MIEARGSGKGQVVDADDRWRAPLMAMELPSRRWASGSRHAR